jgi:uncharacterized protein DUF6570
VYECLSTSIFSLETGKPLPSKVLKTCIDCRTKRNASNARKRAGIAALGELDPNAPLPPVAKRSRTSARNTTATVTETRGRPPNQLGLPTVPAAIASRAEGGFTVWNDDPPLHIPTPSPPSTSEPSFHLPDLDIPDFRSSLPPQDEPADLSFIPPEDWKLLENFHDELDKHQMEYCGEKWFDMKLKVHKRWPEAICHKCWTKDQKIQDGDDFFFSAGNNMDPGAVPPYLPALSQVEEMVIARAHVQMVIKRVRGHQYHYSGHCISFMQDNIKLFDALPLMPEELDVVLLRPNNANKDIIVNSNETFGLGEVRFLHG